jgi:ABC-type multidrug transport system ATPase subunit
VATSHPPAVVLAGATRRYGALVALHGVDLEVHGGEVVVLLGPNGSGKTTLLRLVAGLTHPTEGSIRVMGDVAGSPPARLAVAFVPDEPSGLDELTTLEQARLVAELWGADPRAIPRAVEVFELDGFLDAPVGALSRGLRRRAALAAALAAEPAVLLVDEASVTLDERAVTRLVAELRRRAAAGGTAILATHDLDFAERVADRVVVLRAGRVVGGGPASLARTLTTLAGHDDHEGRVDAPAAHAGRAA